MTGIYRVSRRKYLKIDKVIVLNKTFQTFFLKEAISL